MQLNIFLSRSAASAEFRAAVEEFMRTGDPNVRVSFGPRSPRVKVERTLTKLLQAYPDSPIESVAIDGVSGCDSFRGTVSVVARDECRNVRFEWNCRWKAEQLGWTDWFDLPDQGRAAREFGFDCFRLWDEIDEDELNAA